MTVKMYKNSHYKSKTDTDNTEIAYNTWDINVKGFRYIIHEKQKYMTFKSVKTSLSF